MHDKMHPLPSKEVSQRRRELTPELDKAFHDFSNATFANGRATAQGETADRGRRCAYDAVPILHPQPHAGCTARRRDRA
jgi:hypothetical protein